MKGTIIYKSNYGATKQYAQWLEKETGFPAVSVKDIKPKELKEQDVVIIGCPVIAFQPILKSWIIKKWPVLKDRKVVLFTTSGAPGSSPKLKEIYETSFSAEIRGKIKYFPFSGKMDFDKLNSLHKFFMKLGQKMVKDPEAKANMLRSFDNMDQKLIKPLVDYVKKA